MNTTHPYSWRAGASGEVQGHGDSLLDIIDALVHHWTLGRFIAMNRQGRLVLHFDGHPMGKGIPGKEVPIVNTELVKETNKAIDQLIGMFRNMENQETPR